MDREKVLLSGDTSTSKTLSLIMLAILYPQRRVLIFDPDDGTRKALTELGIRNQFEDLPNLTIFPVRSDWKAMLDFYTQVKPFYGAGDWVCFDMLGRFWDLAQQYYSIRVFGQDPIEHLLNLKQQASKVNFGGFDGLQDWSLIKRMHSELLLDDAVLYSSFNVMATTSTGQYLPIEKVPSAESDPVGNLLALKFGVKLEGEKHNTFRFDTIAVLKRKLDGRFIYRLAKDRGRAVNFDTEFDITNPKMLDGTMTPLDVPVLKSFWSVYLQTHPTLEQHG